MSQRQFPRDQQAQGSSSSSPSPAPDCLPGNVKACLRRLPAAAQRFLTIQGQTSLLARRAADDLLRCLNPVGGYADMLPNSRSQAANEAVAAVLADGAVSVALLRLVAVATRLTPAELCPALNDKRTQTVCARAFLTSGHLVGELLQRWSKPTPHVVDFARKLLRMQTLQALSRQLAAAADALLAARSAQGQSPDQEQQMAIDAVLYQALNVVCLSCSLLNGLIVSPAATHYFTDLVTALHGSCVLEHSARLLLLVEVAERAELERAVKGPAKQEEALGGNPYQAVHDFFQAFSSCVLLFQMATAAMPASPTCAQLREVLSGRCTQYAAVGHG
ncbi:hypothetical protein Agub_g6186, partial [Astrephomene gubernaculifera]